MGLGWGLRTRMSNRLPGEVMMPVHGPHSEQQRDVRQLYEVTEMFYILIVVVVNLGINIYRNSLDCIPTTGMFYCM